MIAFSHCLISPQNRVENVPLMIGVCCGGVACNEASCIHTILLDPPDDLSTPKQGGDVTPYMLLILAIDLNLGVCG